MSYCYFQESYGDAGKSVVEQADEMIHKLKVSSCIMCKCIMCKYYHAMCYIQNGNLLKLL